MHVFIYSYIYIRIHVYMYIYIYILIYISHDGIIYTYLGGPNRAPKIVAAELAHMLLRGSNR